MNKLFLCFCILSFTLPLPAENRQGVVEFNTDWISHEPEVLTYRTKGNNGEGLYQVSISKDKEFIEVYINIISKNFSKSVWGKMSTDMEPMHSKSKIIVGRRVIMDTNCSYHDHQINIETTMKPYNKILKNSITYEKHVIDFSQTPFLERTIPLKVGGKYSFNSLNPRTNKLVPLSIVVLAEESIQNIACYKIELTTFEGKSIHWIEKAAPHRIIRIEQPEENRVSTLIF